MNKVPITIISNCYAVQSRFVLVASVSVCVCVSVNLCVFVRPQLGGHFRVLDQTCEDVFSREDFFRVLRKCTCLFVSPCNSIKTCVHVSVWFA